MAAAQEGEMGGFLTHTSHKAVQVVAFLLREWLTDSQSAASLLFTLAGKCAADTVRAVAEVIEVVSHVVTEGKRSKWRFCSSVSSEIRHVFMPRIAVAPKSKLWLHVLKYKSKLSGVGLLASTSTR